RTRRLPRSELRSLRVRTTIRPAVACLRIGTPRAFEDAMTLKCVMANRDTLEAMIRHLPLRISSLADGELDEYKMLIEKNSAGDRELFLCALLVVMNRLTSPWQIIRFGIKAAGSDTAARVAETPYNVAVAIV